MRLLSTQNWEMKDFLSDADVPPYAILSHTWDDEEVTLQQWENRHTVDISDLKGFKKIKTFGELAAVNSFQWVWVDTCCIDKKSSAELTESINSMFRWYKNASSCYAYLCDVVHSNNPFDLRKSFEGSRWFTRGWTLQELIAPKMIEFFSKEWKRCGTKADLCDAISSVTGVDKPILQGSDLEDVSVAKRMFWASKRKTTRTEDIAYCLLGIFDVNLPLIYGEGLKAFQRLQQAIMVKSHDQSLFAWGPFTEEPLDSLDNDLITSTKPLPWKEPKDREPRRGLFADSPADFADSSNIYPVDHAYAHQIGRRRPPTIVSNGALLDLVIFRKLACMTCFDNPKTTMAHRSEVAILLCRLGYEGSCLVGLVLHPWSDDYHARENSLVKIETFVSYERFSSWTRTRHIMPPRTYHFRHADIILRRWQSDFAYIGRSTPNIHNGPVWRQKANDRVLRMEPDANGDEEIVLYFQAESSKALAVELKRRPITLEPIMSGYPKQLGCLHFDVWLCLSEDSSFGTSANWRRIGRAYEKTMTTSSETWELEVENFPRVHVKADRMALNGGEEVDVVDLLILSHTKAR